MAGMYYQQNLGVKEEEKKDEDHSSSHATKTQLEKWQTQVPSTEAIYKYDIEKNSLE